MKAGRRKSVIAGTNGRSKASALLDDQVYRRIYEAIGGQELPPGTRLREDQMRQIFGVSRARIRKVFSRLAFEGLVQIEPNRGASVARPSAEEARETFAARATSMMVMCLSPDIITPFTLIVWVSLPAR